MNDTSTCVSNRPNGRHLNTAGRNNGSNAFGSLYEQSTVNPNRPIEGQYATDSNREPDAFPDGSVAFYKGHRENNSKILGPEDCNPIGTNPKRRRPILVMPSGPTYGSEPRSISFEYV